MLYKKNNFLYQNLKKLAGFYLTYEISIKKKIKIFLLLMFTI